MQSDLLFSKQWAWGGDTAGPASVDLLGKGAVSVFSLATFVQDDEGQGLVEYALIIAIIAIAVIVAMIFLRDQLANIFSNIGNNLT